MSIPEKSEDVQVEVHRKSSCGIELHVTASSNLVKLARQNAIKEVSKEVTLPGFRKGKAPKELILKKYAGSVEQQLHKSLADLAFVEARKIVKIPVLNNDAPVTFDLKNHSDEGAELLFFFETEPSLPSIDRALFHPTTIVRPEVGEKQIEEAIRQMMFFFAEWKPIERPIQEGDTITIDLDVYEGEKAQRVFHHMRFEVSSKRMAQWMMNLVIGAKAGDVREGMSGVDESATEEEKSSFKPKKVLLTLLKAEEAILPELNDEFAKKVGAPDIPAMRESIATMLNRQSDEHVERSLREQVNEFMLRQYSFELPQSMLNSEKKQRLENLLKDPKFKRSWDQMSQEDRTKFDQKLTDESAAALRLFYLSRQVVQEAKIPITHKEVEDEAIAMLSPNTRKMAVDQIPKEIYAKAISRVFLKKAQNYILQNAT